MPDSEAWARLSLWEHADRLVSDSEVVIDRPAGSPHPKVKSFIYPLDYGFLAGTQGGDGEGVDVWIGSSLVPNVSAVACTVDPVKRNAEVKFLWRCSPDEIAMVERFYEPQPQAAVVIRRPN
jgi:inorganic pyrophosphatase